MDIFIKIRKMDYLSYTSNKSDHVNQNVYKVKTICDVDHEKSCLLQESKMKKLIVTETTPVPVPSKWRRFVILISCLMLILICNGIGYGLSVMYAELIIVFDSPRAEAALIQGLYMGFSTGAGILFISPLKRLGPGRGVMIGTSACVVGLVASGFSQNITSVILLTGCLAAIGMALCYLGAFLTVSWIFYKDPGFYLTCITVGSSAGQMLIPIFYEMFIREYSWSGAFILIAGIGLQCLPLGLIIHFSRRYFYIGDTQTTSKTATGSRTSICDVTLFKDGVMMVLLLNFHLVALTGNVEAWFIVDFIISRGFTRELGSTLVSLIGVSMLIGRCLGSCIRFKFTKIPTIYHWIYMCPITAIAHALIINVSGYWSILVLCMLYGITYGTTTSQTPAIVYEATDLKRYPQGMAMVNVMFGIGNILSTFLGGIIMDTLGKYDAAFYIASGASLYLATSSAFLAFFIRRRNQRKMTLSISTEVTYETFK